MPLSLMSIGSKRPTIARLFAMTLSLRGGRFSSYLAFFVLVCRLDCILRLAWAQETSCQSNEVLLGITFTHQPLDKSEFLDVSIEGPAFRPEGSNSTSDFERFIFYQTLVDNSTSTVVPVVDASVCVPGDQCLTVLVRVYAGLSIDDSEGYYGLLADEISIVYNGQDVSNNFQGPYPYTLYGAMIAGKLGDCEVVCDAGEALLEIDASTGSIDDYDWQVFDDVTGQVIAHCPGSSSIEPSSKCYWMRDQFYSDRLCLANDGCYTLVVGQKYLDKFVATENFVNVVFDGNPILSLESMRYASVKLNEGTTACETSGCGSDARALEIYAFREYLQMSDENITWTVSPVDEEDQTDGIVDNDVVSFGDRAFYYRQACIPNAISCIQFQVSPSPETMDTSSVSVGIESIGNTTYRLVLDGITYGSRDYGTVYDPVVDLAMNSDSSLYAGSTCSASQICSVEFIPVQVDLVTGRTWQVEDFDFRISSISANGMNELFHAYKSILPEESYRFFPCVQASLLLQDEADSCTAFFADTEPFLDGHATYNVSFNGLSFSKQYVPKVSPYGDTITTTLAGSCEILSSAKGTLPGILATMSSFLLFWFVL